VKAIRAAVLCGPLAFCAACDQMNTPIYFPAPTMPALEVSGQPDAMGNPSRAENGLSLQFRNPNSAEQMLLDQQAATLGFDVPWIQRANVHIELTYQVTSMEPPPDPNAPPSSDVPQFMIGIDGANEFTKYDENIVSQAQAVGGKDAPPVIPLIPVTPQRLDPGQTVTGTVREDDFAEAELDLYAIGKWMAPYAAVLINNSQVNPIGLEMVPANAVIPALIEIDVNFTANRPMKCDYTVRVRDDHDQLIHNSTDTLFSPTPALFQPPPPPAP
jgi:hypothetical protein